LRRLEQIGSTTRREPTQPVFQTCSADKIEDLTGDSGMTSAPVERSFYDRRVREVRPAKTLSELNSAHFEDNTLFDLERYQQTTLTYDRAENLARLVQKINALTVVIIFSVLPHFFHRNSPPLA
jgi:hypothetical protein